MLIGCVADVRAILHGPGEQLAQVNIVGVQNAQGTGGSQVLVHTTGSLQDHYVTRRDKGLTSLTSFPEPMQNRVGRPGRVALL